MRKTAGVGIAWFVATIVAVTIAAAAVSNVRSVVTDVPTALGIAAIRAMQAEPDEIDIDDTVASDLEAPTTSTLAPIIVSGMPTEATTTTASTVTTTTRQVETTKSETTTSRPPAQPKSSSPTTTRPRKAADTTPAPPAPTTTTTAPPAPTTTTTAPPAPTTTTTTTLMQTTPSPNAYTRVIETDGGSFTVRVEGDAVIFARATTSTDSVWKFDLLNGGPALVDVQFTSLDNQYSTIRVVVTVTNGELDILRGPS
jgi:hypothetical protein